MTHQIRTATADDAGRLAALAAVTFPLACPPESRPEDIAAHLAKTLSETNFRAYLSDPEITVLVIDADGELRGYSLLVARPTRDPDVAAVLSELPCTELSKCYVHPDHHGLGAAAELMHASIGAAAGDRRPRALARREQPERPRHPVLREVRVPQGRHQVLPAGHHRGTRLRHGAPGHAVSAAGK